MMTNLIHDFFIQLNITLFDFLRKSLKQNYLLFAVLKNAHY